MKSKKDNLAIVRYYDTSTNDGKIEQFLDNMQENRMLTNETIFSLCKPFLEWHECILKQEREEYLLNSGDLSYLEKTKNIEQSLKVVADNLFSPSSVKENETLLAAFRKQWGKVINIRLDFEYKVKKQARKKFFPSPEETLQFHVLTCEDLFKNFKFTEKRAIPENQCIPIKEQFLHKVFMRVDKAIAKERKEYQKSCQYQFISQINKNPIPFIIMMIFFNLLIGLSVGYGINYAMKDNSKVLDP